MDQRKECYLGGSEWVDELELVFAAFRWFDYDKIDQCTNLLWTSQAAGIQKPYIYISITSRCVDSGKKKAVCTVAAFMAYDVVCMYVSR